MKSKVDNARCPQELTGLKLAETPTHAAGKKAVINSLKHVLGAAGTVHGSRVLSKLNQKDGYDCPSCAWPDPDHRAVAEFCENGAKAIASEATLRRITPEFFQQYSIDELGAKSDYWHEQQGRLVSPMLLDEGEEHYKEISWEDAFALIREELQSLPSPEDAIFYTSGRASNEAAFLYQLMVREFGTNNLPDCSNMCHESSGVALERAIGIGKGTVKLEDFANADVVLVIGQNPGTNHPRMLSALQETVRNGGVVISINPLKEAGLKGFAHPQEVRGMLGGYTEISHDFLQVKPNGDQALFKAIAKGLLEREAIDFTFIESKTRHFREYKKAIESEDWVQLSELCGISKVEIDKLVDLIAKTDKIISCWAMGLTQHKNAVATIEELVNLHLLRGAIGKPSAGLCPVRGHSNVQGDRTMGIYEKMPDSFLDKLESEFQFTAPRKHGFDTVEAIRAMKEKPGTVFIALGGNFLSAAPDTLYTAEALRNCNLTVHISTKLNRSHVITGKRALILPCLGRSEMDEINGIAQFVSVENSMGIVHKSKGRFRPASEKLMGEPRIIAKMAGVLLKEKSNSPWEEWANNYDRIRDSIEKIIPGFENFNQRVRRENGFYLPNTARDGDFENTGGKADFSINSLSVLEKKQDQLVLMTIRSHDQFNTTIYGLNDRYRGIYNERRVIFLNPEDMKDRGLIAEQPVRIRSNHNNKVREVSLFLAIPYDIPRGSAAAYFPEANELVPIDDFAEESRTPVSKGVIITVQPH